MNKRLHFLLTLLLSQLLAGCAVYMPIQGAAPQITDRHQAEITGSTYLNGRCEVAGAYSPVRHLLVRAAYSNLPDRTDSTYYRGQQYELAAGTYWPLGAQWLLGGLGGFGQAQSEARYKGSGGLISIGPNRPIQHVFDAHYNKFFGEVYGILQASETISLGAAYRITRVNFTSLTDAGAPVNLSSMVRSEPMLFFRVRLGSGPAATRPIQLQAAWGTSTSLGYDPSLTAPSSADYQLQQPRGYTTIGISLFPHCLLRKTQPNSGGQ